MHSDWPVPPPGEGYAGITLAMRGGAKTVLLRSPGGVYRRVEPKDELRLLDEGWEHYPPPGLPDEHGTANP